MYEHFHHIILYLQNHPHLGGLIAFLIALSESLAIIGTVVPGSVTMTAIGALVGTGVLPAASTITWAILGAFTGDFVSYWFGYYYNERLRKIWPFRKYPNMLAMGESFFRKHGGKSIIIGRFAGPVRSIVPLIAGLMRLSILRFTLAAVPSAILWAILYMMPGILLGALSLELPPSLATKFILGVLALMAVGWLIFWLIHLSFRTITQIINNFIGKLWRYLESHKTLDWITRLLEDPRYPRHHHQLTIAVFTVLCGIIFLLIYLSMITHGFLTHLNLPINELLRSIRNRTTDDIMVVLSIVSDKYAIFAMSVGILAWLAWRRYWRTFTHFFVMLIVTAGAIEVFKRLAFSSRPVGVALIDKTSSFPSGHTTLAVVFFGFIAMLIARELKPPLRRIPFIVASVLSLLVGLSRIYLGAHWFTDILGSIFLGLTIVLLITLSYLRKPTPSISPTIFSIVAAVLFLAVGTAFSFAKFHETEDQYAPYWPVISIDTQTWWQRQESSIPLYITSRLAKPNLALNVEWLSSSLYSIKKNLIAQGWQEHPAGLNIKKTITGLSGQNKHVPLIPILYQNEAPVLLLTKTNKNKQLILQLWKSNVFIEDRNETLWLGNLHYYIPRKQLRVEGQEQIYLGAVEEFMKYLKAYQTQIYIVPEDEKPRIMLPLKWDGKLLLITKPLPVKIDQTIMPNT